MSDLRAPEAIVRFYDSVTDHRGRGVDASGIHGNAAARSIFGSMPRPNRSLDISSIWLNHFTGYSGWVNTSFDPRITAKLRQYIEPRE